MGFIKINNKAIGQKDHRRLELKEFRGVDYSVPKLNVAYNHASHLRNITNKNGINCKRNGWTIEYKMPNGGRINGYWEFELNDILFKVCYVGTQFYVRHSDSEEWKSLDAKTQLIDRKTQMYINDNRAYFIGCGDFLVFGKRDGENSYTLRSVVDDDDTFIPITTAQISHTNSDINTSRYTRDDVNLLTGWRRNTLVGDNANGQDLSYILDDTFTVKDGTVPKLKIENTDELVGEYRGEKVSEGSTAVTDAVIVRPGDKKSLTLNPVTEKITQYLDDENCYPQSRSNINMPINAYGNWMIEFANQNNAKDCLGYRWRLKDVSVSDFQKTDKLMTAQNFLDHSDESTVETEVVGDYGEASKSDEKALSELELEAPKISITTRSDGTMNIELINPCHDTINTVNVFAYYAESPAPNAPNTYTNKVNIGTFNESSFKLHEGLNLITRRAELHGYISFFYTATVNGKEIRSSATYADLATLKDFSVDSSAGYKKYFVTKTHDEIRTRTDTMTKIHTTIDYYKRNSKYETKKVENVVWNLMYLEYKGGNLQSGMWSAATKKYRNTVYGDKTIEEEIDGNNSVKRIVSSKKTRTGTMTEKINTLYYVDAETDKCETIGQISIDLIGETLSEYGEYRETNTEIIGEVNTELIEVNPDYSVALTELVESDNVAATLVITMPSYVSAIRLDTTNLDDAFKPDKVLNVPYTYATTYYGFIPYDSDGNGTNDKYYITLEVNVLVIHEGCNLKPKLPGANLTLMYYESSPNPEAITGAILSTVYGVEGATDMLFAAKDNIVYHSEMGDFTYFPDRYTRTYGSDNTKIKSFIRATDGSLIVLKERSEYEPSVYITKGSWINGFYDSDETEPYTLPSFTANGSVSPQGCIAPYASAGLNNDSLFLSEDGIFAVELSDVTSSQRFIRERSTPINKVLTEIETSALSEATAVAHNNKYYLAIGDKVYVADGRYSFIPDGEMKDTFSYEWYYWDNFPVRIWFIKEGRLWFGTDDGKLCRMTDDAFYDTIEKIWFGAEAKIRQSGVDHTMKADVNGFEFDNALGAKVGDIIKWRGEEYAITEIGSHNVVTSPMPTVTNSGGIPDIDAIIERRQIVSAEYYTPITDFGFPFYNKTMLSFTIALAGDINNNVKFGYTTKKADLEGISAMTMLESLISKISASGHDEQQQGEFDFSGFGFTNFSFDTAFQSSFTKRSTVPKFNYMIFKFENDLPTDMAVSSLSVEYKIEGQNWGVR